MQKSVGSGCTLADQREQKLSRGAIGIGARQADSVMPQMPDLGCEANFLQQANREIADIRLPPVPSQPRQARPRMMIAMPVLALAQLHQRKPCHVAAGIFAGGNLGLGMTDAVDEALRVKRENQPDRSDPEKSSSAEIQAAEK